jgi:hypothetical protein
MITIAISYFFSFVLNEVYDERATSNEFYLFGNFRW